MPTGAKFSFEARDSAKVFQTLQSLDFGENFKNDCRKHDELERINTELS